MGTILNISRISGLSKKLKVGKKKIVLVGGCFDVLHPGHIIFLQKAKEAGDVLIVLLESDEKIKKIKGINRPVHTQIERALVLSAFKVVDYIIPLPNLHDEKNYDQIILKIKPDIIATTLGIEDTHHQRSAKLVRAKLKYVSKIVGDYSTTKILSRKKLAI